MPPVYAVQKGRCPGIYSTWPECQTQILGVKGAVYQKFTNHSAAEEFIRQGSEILSDQKVTKQVFTVAQAFTSDVDMYVYTDGACSNNGRPGAKAGIGIWFGSTDSRNVSQTLILENQKPTNNIAELTAILKALPLIDPELQAGKRVAIVSDSQYAIRCVGTYGETQAANNWQKDIPNKELVRQVYEAYHNLEKSIQFLYVPAHTEHTDFHSVGNAGADLLANQAIGLSSCPYSEKEQIHKNRIDLQVPYKDKDLAKSLGAKWDPAKKVWYCFTDSEHAEKLMAKFTAAIIP